MKNDDLIIHPKRAKGEDGYRVFSIRIREELVEQLEEITAKTCRSRNELIGKFIEYALEHCQVLEDGQEGRQAAGGEEEGEGPGAE